jgi:hypothetical protein
VPLNFIFTLVLVFPTFLLALHFAFAKFPIYFAALELLLQRHGNRPHEAADRGCVELFKPIKVSG